MVDGSLIYFLFVRTEVYMKSASFLYFLFSCLYYCVCICVCGYNIYTVVRIQLNFKAENFTVRLVSTVDQREA